MLFEIFCMLYVDDGAFAFVSRRDLEIGATLVYNQFARLGLEMHVGKENKKSKTECVFFPAPGHFKPPPLPPSTPPSDPSALPVTLKPKQESEEQKRRRHDILYDEAKETGAVVIGDHDTITFTKHFKYLGGYLSYSLRDDYDVDERLSQASSAMGALNHFWSDRTVDDYSKYLIFRAIPINLLLWGCESWALREAT